MAQDDEEQHDDIGHDNIEEESSDVVELKRRASNDIQECEDLSKKCKVENPLVNEPKIEFNFKVQCASHEFRDMLRILKYHVIFLEFKDETYEHECQSVGGTFFTLLTDQSKPARETDTPVQRIQGIRVKPMQSSI